MPLSNFTNVPRTCQQHLKLIGTRQTHLKLIGFTSKRMFSLKPNILTPKHMKITEKLKLYRNPRLEPRAHAQDQDPAPEPKPRPSMPRPALALGQGPGPICAKTKCQRLPYTTCAMMTHIWHQGGINKKWKRTVTSKTQAFRTQQKQTGNQHPLI